MSDLHLSLVIFGLLVIVSVVAYNWIQEQKFRKIAQQRFQTPREDVLMTSSDDPAAEAQNAKTETLDDVRIEPSLKENYSTEPAAVEPAVESSAKITAPASVSRKPESEYPAPIDSAIEYIVRLDFSEPVQAAAVRSALGALEFGKPVQWLVHNATGQWEALARARDRLETVSLYGGLQLADRAGAVSRDELNAFTQQVQQAGEILSAVVQLPERQNALEIAAKLDEFCADVDILVGVNVIALEQSAFLGTKIRALAEAGGFTLARDGTYQYCDDHGTVLYSLSNQESAPFSADAIKNLTTHGLTMLFDVPRIPNGLRAFEHMISFARQLTDSLKGLMVDDNLRPLTEEGVSKIKQQLSLIYGKMDKNGIPAGSARAQRLFS